MSVAIDDAVRAFGVVHAQVRPDVDGADDAEPLFSSREERVAHEEPLEIQVNGVALAVLMRTPGDDEDLGRGFLITERIVASLDDVESLRHCTTAPDVESDGNVLQVRLRVPFDLERHRRHTFASSSCGVCGKATIENACALAPALDDDVHVSADALARMPDLLRSAQRAFTETGGVHGAALFAVDNVAPGAPLFVREDVGRHNAVDKVIGAMLVSSPSSLSMSSSLSLARSALLVSGRVSFEIVQKAAAARVPVVAGISAPTSLAVRMARALNVTLVGFLRGASMNVYAGESRVVDARPR